MENNFSIIDLVHRRWYVTEGCAGVLPMPVVSVGSHCLGSPS